jgi:hypothetical protein
MSCHNVQQKNSKMKYEVNSSNNKINEGSLQQTYEAILKEIQQMKLGPLNEKKLIAMLQKYRSAWNTYINRIKPRGNRSDS